MTIKWSKKICIQFIQEMRSPIEEMARQGANGNHSLLERIRAKVGAEQFTRPPGGSPK